MRAVRPKSEYIVRSNISIAADVYSLVGLHYRSSAWRLAYSEPFRVVLTDDLAVLKRIEPFPVRISHGRKKRKRGVKGVRPTEASQREMPALGGNGAKRGRAAGAPQHCSRCKGLDHNARTCKAAKFDQRYAAFF